MRASSALLYVSSKHSTKSRWMPWELGFFDGHKGKVGIVPITEDQNGPFKGQEYVSLYPSVQDFPIKGTTNRALWIMVSNMRYAKLIPWIRGDEQIRSRE
jgi:hypothetical protein